MATLTVVTPTSTDIDVLAARLRAGVERAEASMATTVEAMIEVGETLIEARAAVPEGQLKAWAKAVVGMDPKTVTTYVRFAENADILREHQPQGTGAARRLLASMDVSRINSANSTRAEAERLKKAGLTQKAIADQLGISRPRVSQLLNHDKHKANERAKKRDRAAAQKALARERQAAEVKKSGNEHASKAYAHVRKALQELDKAFSDTPVDKQKYLRLAMDMLYRGEDNIASALKK